MAALSSDRNTEYSLGDLLAIPVAGSTEIFAGSLVCTDSGGYAVPGADTAGYTFEGVATEHVDNSAGSAGDKRAIVRRRGRYHFDCASPLNQASMSGEVCVSDDQTVADDSDVTNGIACGRIDKIESDGSVWISIDRYAATGKSWAPPTTTTTTVGPTTTTTAAA